MDPLILKEFGPWVAVVGVLLWWIWQDRRRNDERYDEIVRHVRRMETERQKADAEHSSVLVELNHRSINAMRDVTSVLRELLESMGKRPCLHRQSPDDDSVNIPLPSDVKKPKTEPLMKTPPKGIDTVRASTAALLCVLLMSSCDRTSPETLADARAGAIAYQQEGDHGKRDAIGRGMAGHVLAATEGAPLPQPAKTPDEIRADPADYANAGDAVHAKPPVYEPPAPPPKPGPSPADQLRELGRHVLWWGGIAAAVGLALVGVGLAGRFLPLGWVANLVAGPIVAPLARVAASLGSASVVIGAAMSWLAAWLWAVVLAVVLVAAGLAWWHRKDLAAAWRRAATRAHT
jgi:hypothetical protein